MARRLASLSLAALALFAGGVDGRLRVRRPRSSRQSTQDDDKRSPRILMLISDTGGGHRASGNALKSMMKQLGPPGTDIKVVDIWTEHAAWPHNQMAAGYPFLCKHPMMWRALYFGTKYLELPWQWETRVRCGAGFRKCIEEYNPDMIVSLHPLCQNLPLAICKQLQKEGKMGNVPFATVCTDLGGAHDSWFHKGVDLNFVPSDAVRNVAIRRGVKPDKIRQYGLPVRSDFWRASDRSARPSDSLFSDLGLHPDKRTVLVIGGGDGVGSLGDIVDATASQLADECPGSAQVVALCGRNKRVLAQLEQKKRSGVWDGVNVELRGFTQQVSSYMEVADCLVTKAGPGTIAEAAIRGLPTMLSSYLPGQEAGNVPFVLEHGFGEFARQPKAIAARVSAWLQDEPLLEKMHKAASSAATPLATHNIAVDLLELLDEADRNA